MIMGKKKVQGFTLIEMSIVLFIIALLILIILPNIGSQRQRGSVKKFV
ncbi:prepilin-type N-terminal cleavage/methylation domain-containing protein [Liquorilactobacillus nagelii]|nr:prepilin-type N-terminal cleavage/methylation domain-containing protein [Liquorilactobacillus nagelii]